MTPEQYRSAGSNFITHTLVVVVWCNATNANTNGSIPDQCCSQRVRVADAKQKLIQTMSKSYKTYADSSEMSIEESKLKVIQAIPDGRENAIPGGDIAKKIPQKATTLYDMIPELRSQYGIPVGSCVDGYFIVTDPDELQTQIDRYDSQIQTAQRRKRELVKAFNRGKYDE